MHQPYYKNLLTQEVDLPWVRLHGTKDYLDMVEILEKYPAIHLTFNLVPCLIEQIEDYTSRTVNASTSLSVDGKRSRTIKDKYLELSYKPAKELTGQDKSFIQENFFFINKEKAISLHPRYYELFLKKQAKKEFSTQDYLDLQVWLNLAWIDPIFRQSSPELKNIVNKARFFTEEEKQVVLAKQIELLEDIIPAYRKSMESAQIEISVSPYYHPILPLLYSTNTAKEANPKAVLPKVKFAYPQDCQAQIQEAVKFYQSKFGVKPAGMWPSEEAVSEHILPFIIESGINWIVADEAILFKSLKIS
jgi:alpha-amylase/alpha-mannosidase (GH57 family)